MLPNTHHGERPIYVPTPLNPATQAATSPIPRVVRPWNPTPISTIKRSPARAPAEDPVLIAGGPNPAEAVNAINPSSQLVSMASPLPTPTLRVDTEAPAGDPGNSGRGFTQLAFLAGAVFVAWLALRH